MSTFGPRGRFHVARFSRTKLLHSGRSIPALSVERVLAETVSDSGCLVARIHQQFVLLLPCDVRVSSTGYLLRATLSRLKFPCTRRQGHSRIANMASASIALQPIGEPATIPCIFATILRAWQVSKIGSSLTSARSTANSRAAQSGHLWHGELRVCVTIPCAPCVAICVKWTR